MKPVPALVGALLLLFSSAGGQSLSDRQLTELTFHQNLGTQVSLGLQFVDEEGHPVLLRQYFGRKPVILVFGYYECPMLCTFVLNGMVESLEDLKWSIGNEFDVINISINPHEKPELAAAKRKTYLKRYGRAGAGAGWHFLTGYESSIQQLAKECGFEYAYDQKTRQYAHPSGLVFLTAGGRIAAYQLGVTFTPNALFKSLQQADSGKPGSPVPNLILLCFHYNPITGKYGALVMGILRAFALGTFCGLCWMVVSVIRHERLKQNSRPPDAVQAQPGAEP